MHHERRYSSHLRSYKEPQEDEEEQEEEEEDVEMLVDEIEEVEGEVVYDEEYMEKLRKMKEKAFGGRDDDFELSEGEEEEEADDEIEEDDRDFVDRGRVTGHSVSRRRSASGSGRSSGGSSRRTRGSRAHSSEQRRVSLTPSKRPGRHQANSQRYGMANGGHEMEGRVGASRTGRFREQHGEDGEALRRSQRARRVTNYSVYEEPDYGLDEEEDELEDDDVGNDEKGDAKEEEGIREDLEQENWRRPPVKQRTWGLREEEIDGTLIPQGDTTYH